MIHLPMTNCNLRHLTEDTLLGASMMEDKSDFYSNQFFNNKKDTVVAITETRIVVLTSQMMVWLFNPEINGEQNNGGKISVCLKMAQNYSYMASPKKFKCLP